MTILVTNDDGRNSEGLETLFRAAKRVDKDTVAIVPQIPKSGTGKAFTVHKPLRIASTVDIDGCAAYELSGTPADCVIYGSSVYFKGRAPKMVVSGINIGNNTTVQSILSSGTLGACFEAGLYDIPAIGFSQDAPRESWYDSRRAAKSAVSWEFEDFCFKLMNQVIERGMPAGAHVLSVNFPRSFSSRTKVVYCKPDLRKFINFFEKRKDPSKREYYWNNIRNCLPKSKTGDFFNLLRKSCVTITPLSIAFSTDDMVTKARALYDL